MTWRAFSTLLATLLAALLPVAQETAKAGADLGAIAYVRTGASNGTELHVINPDGSGDHIILTLPQSPVDFVPTLAWKPDATELAFASDHESAASLFGSDIYAVQLDGSNLRRLTNGPDSSKLAAYPQGSVTVNVQLFGGGGPYFIYIAGASELKAVTGSQLVTFAHVADFGPNRAQGVVAINGNYRWFNSAAADVQPNQTVNAGSLLISGEGLPYGVGRPTWRSDGTKVGFEGNGFAYVVAQPADGDLGTPLIKPNFVLGYPSLMDWSPAPAKANQILYQEWDIDAGHIYLTTEDSTETGDLLYTYDAGEKLLDLKWLPDGSGFVFALTENSQTASNLWKYDFATQQVTELTHFTNEIAGAVSIAPDGQTIVFEHAPDFSTKTDLWVVQSDGSNSHLFVKDAARPAWSHITPQVGTSPTGTPMPTATQAPLPTATPTPDTPIGAQQQSVYIPLVKRQ